MYGYVICSNFRALFVFALHISCPVDHILNKVKKVNLSCVLFYSESPLSWLNGQPLWFIMNSLCQYGDKLLLILNVLESNLSIYETAFCCRYVINTLLHVLFYITPLYHAPI